jgi:hypothetical protein
MKKMIQFDFEDFIDCRLSMFIYYLGVLMVKWIEYRPFISMIRGSNPGLVIGIFLRYFIISATFDHQDPGESTFHYHQLKQLNFSISLLSS